MTITFPQHLLSIDDLSLAQIQQVFVVADQASHAKSADLSPKHQVVANLFFENSTRTRCSFEIAAKKIGAEVMNFDFQTSSIHKGETWLDTVDNLQAMGVNYFVIRHREEEFPFKVARHLGERASVINAGNGSQEHPTQALLDAYTLSRHFSDFAQLKIAIVGDIRHSRVAHSNVKLLTKLGVKDIRLVGPASLLPTATTVHCEQNLLAGIEGVDVVMMLRIQKERIDTLDLDDAAYHADYGLTVDKLRSADPKALVMHPGPINRGLELTSEVADGPQSIILEQVRNGVFIRMAVLKLLKNTF
ncbi:MAG: aspartate carbamoyltransferase catalytic subunit [Gammaproteobacteria bacterium]